MPKKKSSSEGEYSSAISRFLPGSGERTSEERASGKSRDVSKSQKQESEIVLNDDRDKEEPGGASSAQVNEETTSAEASERAKVRLTAPYVNEAVSHIFEESWLKLRRMTGEKVSQSEVIEAALAIACDEFAKEEENSALYRAIASIRNSM